MKPLVRTLFLSLMIGFIGNFVCFIIAALFSLVVNGVASSAGSSSTLIEALYIDLIVSSVISSIVVSIIICGVKCSFGAQEPSNYWKERIIYKRPGVKFGKIILTLIPHLFFFIACIVWLAAFGDSLAQLAKILNTNRGGLAYAHLLTAVISVIVFQFNYCVFTFIQYLLAKCSMCDNVYSLVWERTGTEDEMSQKTKRSVETTKDYYAGEGVFKGQVRSRNRDIVVEHKVNVKTVYGIYNCRCAYCNNTVRKRVFDHSETK